MQATDLDMESDDCFKRGIRHYEDDDYDAAIYPATPKPSNQTPAMFLLGVIEDLYGGKKTIFKKLLPTWNEAIRIKPDTAASSWLLRSIV